MDIKIFKQQGEYEQYSIRNHDTSRGLLMGIPQINKAMVQMVPIGLERTFLMDNSTYKEDTQGVQQRKKDDGKH